MRQSRNAFVFVAALTLLTSNNTLAGTPGNGWMQFDNPSQAGFDPVKFMIVDSLVRNSDAAAVMIVRGGAVVKSWGEIDRRFECASIRKSLLHSVFGIYVENGAIDTTATLEKLGIDEIVGLTDKERQARVADLLASRSGIYLPSAFAPRSMKERLPERGSHAPGTFWFYNNWDFNALGSIFNQATQITVQDAFLKHIAEPLQMQDFSLKSTYNRVEPDVSKHPAYLFRMSARDLARFALLYCRGGVWGEKQIIPERWIAQSTRPISDAPEYTYHRSAYGYLWWVADDVFGQPAYFASGSGGQIAIVFPKSDLVVIHLVNTYDNHDVHDAVVSRLLTAILDAMVGVVSDDFSQSPLTVVGTALTDSVLLPQETIHRICGSYRHKFLGGLTVAVESERLILKTGIGEFPLHAVNDSTLIPEDILIRLVFTPAADSSTRATAETVFDSGRKTDHVEFRY